MELDLVEMTTITESYGAIMVPVQTDSDLSLLCLPQQVLDQQVLVPNGHASTNELILAFLLFVHLFGIREESGVERVFLVAVPRMCTTQWLNIVDILDCLHHGSEHHGICAQ